MKVSARSEYACRALVELACCYPDRRVKQLKEIAGAQAIPDKYLVHILLQLKQHGLIGSIRGASGGYYLRIAPSKITLGEVIRIVDGPLLPLQVIPATPGSGKEQEEVGVFKDVWEEVSVRIAKVMDSISFADILERMQERGKDLYQI